MSECSQSRFTTRGMPSEYRWIVSTLFGPKSVETIHLYSLGIPRVVNLLCEHSLINAYVEQQRPITPKIVEDVAHEFQLDEVEPTAPAGSTRIDRDVYNSEAFIQNLGGALSKVLMRPPVSSSTRERK